MRAALALDARVRDGEYLAEQLMRQHGQELVFTAVRFAQRDLLPLQDQFGVLVGRDIDEPHEHPVAEAGHQVEVRPVGQAWTMTRCLDRRVAPVSTTRT